MSSSGQSLSKSLKGSTFDAKRQKPELPWIQIGHVDLKQNQIVKITIISIDTAKGKKQANKLIKNNNHNNDSDDNEDDDDDGGDDDDDNNNNLDSKTEPINRQ